MRAPDRDYHLHAGDQVVLRGAPMYLAAGERIENGTTMRITTVDERHDRITVSFARASARETKATLDLAALRIGIPGLRRPALRLAFARPGTPAPPPVRYQPPGRSATRSAWVVTGVIFFGALERGHATAFEMILVQLAAVGVAVTALTRLLPVR